MSTLALDWHSIPSSSLLVFHLLVPKDQQQGLVSALKIRDFSFHSRTLGSIEVLETYLWVILVLGNLGRSPKKLLLSAACRLAILSVSCLVGVVLKGRVVT